MNSKIKIVTFASRNPHVSLLARNLEASVKAAGIGIPFEIAPLDSDGCSGFGGSVYWELVVKKIRGVHDRLEDHDIVIHCDSDVVFLRNEMPSLLAMAETYDFVAQSDAPSEHVFTAGLFLATKNARKLFDTDGLDRRYFGDGGFGDQGMINDRLKSGDSTYRAFLLSQSEYPNGWLWYRFHMSIAPPVAVHYNWIDNLPEKIERMKQFGHWFL